MQKLNRELLNECVDEGIITGTERFQVEALSDYKIKKQREISKNFVDLIQVLLFVLLLNSSFIIFIISSSSINDFIKYIFSGILVIVNLVCFYRSHENGKYFFQEIFILSLWFSIFMLMKSVNNTNAYNYSLLENVFIADILLIPVVLLSNSFITLLMVVISLVLIKVPELNLAWIMIPNAVQLLSVILIYIAFICYKYRKIIIENNKTKNIVRPYHKFYDDKAACIMLETMFYLVIGRLYWLCAGQMDVVFIYIAMIYMLYRRSKTYAKVQYIPQIVDFFYFMYMMLYFFIYDAKDYIAINFIFYHMIYYLVFLLMDQNNKFENISSMYKLQHHFYCNMFLFIFVVSNFTTTNLFWIVVLIIVGLFNSHIAIQYKNTLYGVIGFIIILITLFVATYVYPTWQMSLLIFVTSLVVLKFNYSRFKKVSE